jgi:hypothetical protein
VGDPGFPVLWIDPGKMTGLALYDAGSAPDFHCTELPFIEAGDMIEQMCGWYKKRLRVGWEHFHVHAKTPGDDAHHAMEMIGVARRAAYVAGCITFKPAQPGERFIATMQMLEHIGWWRPGLDDAQSAAQHMLAWMYRSGNVPSLIEVELARFREEKNT